MDEALLQDVSDPSDWTGSWSELRHLDMTLRCGLCFDIFRAPVAFRECAHVYCSSCIRMHINQPGGAGAFCPNCRQKKAYDSELVVQPVLEAASNHWRHTRSFLMKQWQKMQELESKRSEMKGAEANGEPHETLARSRKRVRGTPDEDQDYRALDAGTIVQCPICQREFDAIAINAHLDRGCGTEDPGPPTMDHWLRASSPVTHSPEKRLTRPQYQLKTERDMRKLLEALQLPTSGNKDRMVERHRHWVNLYNANLDAAPALRTSLPSLRKQLMQWERSHGEMTAKNVPTEKQAKAWLKANQHAYTDLIAQARSTLPSNISEHAKNSEK